MKLLTAAEQTLPSGGAQTYPVRYADELGVALDLNGAYWSVRA